MATETTDGTRAYYHVAGEGYGEGEDLYSFDELEGMGYAVEWKWEGEPVDTDVVCLFESLDEAREMVEAYGGTILQVSLPEDYHTVTVAEGYTAVPGHIPAEFVSRIN